MGPVPPPPPPKAIVVQSTATVQNALDCNAEKFNLENFYRGAHTRTFLEKYAAHSPGGHYCAHNGTVYYISRPPLSQNLSAPGAPVSPDNIKTLKRLTVMCVSKYNCSISVAILLPFIFKEGKGLH